MKSTASEPGLIYIVQEYGPVDNAVTPLAQPTNYFYSYQNVLKTNFVGDLPITFLITATETGPSN